MHYIILSTKTPSRTVVLQGITLRPRLLQSSRLGHGLVGKVLALPGPHMLLGLRGLLPAAAD